jgi:hypothetical protein
MASRRLETQVRELKAQPDIAKAHKIGRPQAAVRAGLGA